jgi:hypothetical protein
LNTFVASFKKFLKTVSKCIQKNSVQFGCYIFLNVFSVLKTLSFEGSFHCKKEKSPLVRDQENRVDGLYPHHRVWPEIFSPPVRNGRGIVVQEEPPAICSKLWPPPGNALQQSSDNRNREHTVDFLPFRHKFFMNRTLFVKKYDQHGFDLGLFQTKLFGPW